MISNSTAIGEIFSKINNKFDKLFTNREFVHLYVS